MKSLLCANHRVRNKRSKPSKVGALPSLSEKFNESGSLVNKLESYEVLSGRHIHSACWRQGQYHIGKKEKQSPLMGAEGIFHPVGMCSLPLAEMGAKVTSKRRSVIPGNLTPNLALWYLKQRGPLTSLLSISPTYGKMETQETGKLLSLPS